MDTSHDEMLLNVICLHTQYVFALNLLEQLKRNFNVKIKIKTYFFLNIVNDFGWFKQLTFFILIMSPFSIYEIENKFPGHEHSFPPGASRNTFDDRIFDGFEFTNSRPTATPCPVPRVSWSTTH